MDTNIKPEIETRVLEAEDPTFEGGSVHTATATLTNPTTSQFTYVSELYLGILKTASSGLITTAIPAGGSVGVPFPIVMPLTPGTYEVYLDITVGGDLIAHYKGTEDVVIEVSPAIEVGPIIWV